MATTNGILKVRALALITAATTLDDVAYLTKGIVDSGDMDSTTEKAIYDKVVALQGTATAKQVSYIMSALQNSSKYDTDIYQLGTPGQIGFGVATCPSYLIPTGWSGLDGHDRITSQNYGNYIDENGSVLVYVPKHYFKYVGNELSFTQNALTGYVLDRSFVNAGAGINGVFVYKYDGSAENGKFVSKRFAKPCSTNAAHNPISVLSTAPTNTYGGMYKAVKSAGANYFVTPQYQRAMLARLALAHGKAATSTAACAFIDVNPKMPKGNLNNALRDINDAGVAFTSDGYSNCALTGSGVPFAKTTHNGQECGISDVTGNMYKLASGFIRMDATGFLVLKESVDIRTITDDTTGATGAYNTALYDVLDLDDLAMTTAGAWTYFGNAAETVFAMSTDRTSNAYKRTAFGLPNATGVSAAGTTEFGNDGLYKMLRNEMACIVGGYWSNASYAGPFFMFLNDNRTHSNYYTGGRASYLV